MWTLLFLACSGSDSSEPPPIPGAGPIPITAPPTPTASAPEVPAGPLPKLAPTDLVVVQWSADEVGDGAVALACATAGGVTADCDMARCKPNQPCGEVWAAGVTALPAPGVEGQVVIGARRSETTLEPGPQCSWIRVRPVAGSAPTASAPRPVRPVAELPAPLQARPPHRAWSLDLDGDGADEVLYEQAEHGATNTIGVVKADGSSVVIWQDEAPGPAPADAEEGGGAAPTSGSWSTVVGVTDTTLDGKLEIVLDLDRHDSFGWAVFSYAPTGAAPAPARLAGASCKL